MTSGEGINSWVMTKPWMSDTPIEPYTATSLRQFKLALAQAKEIKYINFQRTSKGKKIDSYDSYKHDVHGKNRWDFRSNRRNSWNLHIFI